MTATLQFRAAGAAAAMLAVSAWAQYPAFGPPPTGSSAASAPARPSPGPSRTAASGTVAQAAAPAAAEAAVSNPPPPWVEVAQRHLDEALRELEAARKRIAEERVPLANRTAALEAELIATRGEYEAQKRLFDGRALELNNVRSEIKAREQESAYLSTLFSEYLRGFETRLHIAEVARYGGIVADAKLAAEDSSLPPANVFARQAAAIEQSLDRLDRLIGGDRYSGQAAGPDGRLATGLYAMLGPMAFFAADDNGLVGLAEQKLGSLEPSVETFADPAMEAAAREFVLQGWGSMPLDGSLGNARKIERTRETLWEHIRKGGAVMWPILGVAAVSALVSIAKWIALAVVRVPEGPRLRPLMDAVSRRDAAGAAEAIRRWAGPAAAMVRAGIEHLDQSKELIEEVMFEQMLAARFRFQRFLPIVAVAAASAPLLGLLGTVTGIISTFKLLTVFGSGDIKMLSAGISEALITTEFGLYIAIPSLLSHSFLSRKAKALSDRLERIAIAFLAEVEKAQERRMAA